MILSASQNPVSPHQIRGEPPLRQVNPLTQKGGSFVSQLGLFAKEAPQF